MPCRTGQWRVVRLTSPQLCTALLPRTRTARSPRTQMGMLPQKGLLRSPPLMVPRRQTRTSMCRVEVLLCFAHGVCAAR